MARKKFDATTAKKLRVITRLSGSVPLSTSEDRLDKIADICSGKLDPDKAPRRGATPDLAKRIHAGQASVARGNALDRITDDAEREKETARRMKAEGRDRQEKGGRNRGGK